MAIVIVRGKWVCNFMVSSYCDVGDGDGDYDDDEEPTATSYRRADKSLARPTSRCILFDGEISFEASLVIYIYCMYTYIHIYSFIHSVFCLTTGPKPPPKRFLHMVRSRASSFK